MKATIIIMLISILILSSIIGVSATISHTTGHGSHNSLNQIDDNYQNTEINIEKTFTDTDYYSGSEWSLTFTTNS